MANSEHLERLMESEAENNGMKRWNKWRQSSFREVTDYMVDLTGATLLGLELSNVNLGQANLTGSNFSNSNLLAAVFKQSRLSSVDFTGTDLSYSDLSNSDLGMAKFNKSKLISASLSGSYLVYVELIDANLTGVYWLCSDVSSSSFDKSILTDSEFIRTKISNCNFGETDFHMALFNDCIIYNCDLSVANNLATIEHFSPTIIDSKTLMRSRGVIPEAFLIGCGLTKLDMLYAKMYNRKLSNFEISEIGHELTLLLLQKPIKLRPIFISYSFKDAIVASKIYNRLNVDELRVWMAEHDMISGPINRQIHDRIDLNSIAIVILSENSIKSPWVIHEIKRAAKRQQELVSSNQTYTLCPIAIDDSWKTHNWDDLGPEGDELLRMNVMNFSDWKDNSTFEKMYGKMVDGFKKYY